MNHNKSVANCMTKKPTCDIIMVNYLFLKQYTSCNPVYCCQDISTVISSLFSLKASERVKTRQKEEVSK